MSKFISGFAKLIGEFVSYRKASMRWSKTYEANIHSFDSYCAREYPTTSALTNEMIATWCKKRPSEKNRSCRSRIYCVVGLVRYLNDQHEMELAEPELPRRGHYKYLPHPYTNEELHQFFYECDHLPEVLITPDQRNRRITIPVFFRLLYSSGIRPIEARMLKTTDIDLNSGIVGITVSKGYDQRFIVLHDTMLDLMVKYDKAISQHFPSRSFFFPARNDGFHSNWWITDNYRQLWSNVSHSYSRPYDLRHNYATENINQWIETGFEYDSKLTYLSKSMGHRDLECTKYYYSFVPALSDILISQTENSFNALVPEVEDEESY